jgi:signal transduction histidine kinase
MKHSQSTSLRNSTRKRAEPPADARSELVEKLLHELQVHQIELKMQNAELRQAQLELEASRDRYVDLYEFAPVGYLTLSPHGLISSINLIGCHLLKADRKKLLKHRFSSFILKPDVDRWYKFSLMAMSEYSGNRHVLELQLQRDDDSIIDVQLDCLRISNEDEEAVLRIVLTDITARKQAEMRLRESEDQYRTLFESIDQGYCVIEMRVSPNEPLDYRYIDINRAFEKQSTLVDARGKWMRELRPDHEEYWFEIYRDVALTGIPVSFEQHGKTLGDRWFAVFAFRIGPPELKHVAILFSDVTERKTTEVALTVAFDELEHKVQERTSELRRTNQELLQAKQIAEHASQAKSDILSNTSHELRTPLNSLLLLAELLTENSERNLSDKEVKYAAAILDAGRDLLSLVNDLLDLAQIESGRPPPLSLDDINWDHLHQTLMNGFVELAQKKKLKYNLHMDKNLPVDFKTDEKRLLQILKNLLSNAFKFTTSGSVDLDIALVRSGWTKPHVTLDSASKVIEFSVSDTGIGISEDNLIVIFEAFRQADTGTSRQYGGTGLGLTVSRELAAMLGGVIEVGSKLGTGSAFKLYLPM